MQKTATPVAHDLISTTVPSPCKICGELTPQKYLGVVTCPSCKMFFKRNAEADQVQMRCHFGGDCHISVHTRHTCRSCRLKKCFANGMQSERLHGSFSKTTKRKARKTKTGDSHMSTSIVPAKTTQTSRHLQFPTLNLFRSDQSTLNVEQRNLLSNLIHCYDEHSGFSAADRFVRMQNALPIKSRFKVTPVSDLAASLMAGAQLLFEKNADFHLLNSHDRSLLLHGNLKYIGSLGGCFIVHSMGLFDNPAYYSTAEIVHGSATAAAGKRAGAQIDSDIVFVKLTLAIILFSTFDHTISGNTTQTGFRDIRALWRIQDTYTELAWRYLVYEYSYPRAVMSFSNLIRCIFTIINVITEATREEEYKNLVDSLIKQAEETITLKN